VLTTACPRGAAHDDAARDREQRREQRHERQVVAGRVAEEVRPAFGADRTWTTRGRRDDGDDELVAVASPRSARRRSACPRSTAGRRGMGRSPTAASGGRLPSVLQVERDPALLDEARMADWPKRCARRECAKAPMTMTPGAELAAQLEQRLGVRERRDDVVGRREGRPRGAG
jgi:hypothetical protein